MFKLLLFFYHQHLVYKSGTVTQLGYDFPCLVVFHILVDENRQFVAMSSVEFLLVKQFRNFANVDQIMFSQSNLRQQ